jgi:hypothetical protein
MTATMQISSLRSSLFARMQEMNRSWLESLREIREIESDFGYRLLIAETPAEAANICNAWMARRLEAIANEQRAFTLAWLALISDVVDSESSTGTPRGGFE